MSEKVYKIRNKRTGQWAVFSFYEKHFVEWAHDGSDPRDEEQVEQLWFARSLADGITEHGFGECEVVEFTLSDPRVVTP